MCICICMSMQQHTAIYSRQDTLTRRAGECTDLLGWDARLALAQGPGARDNVPWLRCLHVPCQQKNTKNDGAFEMEVASNHQTSSISSILKLL